MTYDQLQSEFNSRFSYSNGELFWKVKPCAWINIGNKVGSLTEHGYLETKINKKVYRLHRVIFLMHHGYLPKLVDHINGNKQDNRIENLRPANKSQNSSNAKIHSRNTSGIRGVSFSKKTNKWVVQVVKNAKNIYCGSYIDLELAELVSIEARNKYHGEYART
jgi:hypothetical protein